MTAKGWEPGQLLADRYRLETCIGSGGMGEVWRAEHVQLKSPVAVKLLPEKVTGDEMKSARFLREARAAAAIRSSHIVQVLDYGVHDGAAFIAMEYLEGESLQARLKRRGRISPTETLRVITQVAKGMGRAHKRGIIHRDLKPANIFIADEDEGEIVKVLDFGIAKLTEDQELRLADTTQTGAMLGTPYYMSPEQARGHKELDHRADLWSVGVITFECLTGKRPLDGATVGDLIFKICGEQMPKPSSVAPVPPSFDAWYARATEREREDRFQSAKEMALALREALVDVGRPVFDSIEDYDTSETEIPDRESIEMLDTLMEKKLSDKPPESDSWESSDDRVPTPDPIAPPPPRESLRDTSAMSRTAATPLPPKQNRSRLLIAAGVAAVVAAAAVIGLRGGSGADPTATSPQPAPPQSPPARAPTVVSERSAAAAGAPLPNPPPAARVEGDTSARAVESAASARRSPRAQPARPKPASKPKPAASGGKIEFGI